jgi:hypothetical protein
MTAGDGDCTIRVEADGLSAQRAEILLQRLHGLAIVRSVGLAWRGLAALERGLISSEPQSG